MIRDINTAKIKQKIDQVIYHLRLDTEKFNESKAQAMFEISAEVLLRIRKTFDNYENGTEQAVQKETQS